MEQALTEVGNLKHRAEWVKRSVGRVPGLFESSQWQNDRDDLSKNCEFRASVENFVGK